MPNHALAEALKFDNPQMQQVIIEHASPADLKDMLLAPSENGTGSLALRSAVFHGHDGAVQRVLDGVERLKPAEHDMVRRQMLGLAGDDLRKAPAGPLVLAMNRGRTEAFNYLVSATRGLIGDEGCDWLMTQLLSQIRRIVAAGVEYEEQVRCINQCIRMADFNFTDKSSDDAASHISQIIKNLRQDQLYEPLAQFLLKLLDKTPHKAALKTLLTPGSEVAQGFADLVQHSAVEPDYFLQCLRQGGVDFDRSLRKIFQSIPGCPEMLVQALAAELFRGYKVTEEVDANIRLLRTQVTDLQSPALNGLAYVTAYRLKTDPVWIGVHLDLISDDVGLTWFNAENAALKNAVQGISELFQQPTRPSNFNTILAHVVAAKLELPKASTHLYVTLLLLAREYGSTLVITDGKVTGSKKLVPEQQSTSTVGFDPTLLHGAVAAIGEQQSGQATESSGAALQTAAMVSTQELLAELREQGLKTIGLLVQNGQLPEQRGQAGAAVNQDSLPFIRKKIDEELATREMLLSGQETVSQQDAEQIRAGWLPETTIRSWMRELGEMQRSAQRHGP